MELFIGNRLIKSADGYILELFINQELSEFAEDFDRRSEEENRNLINSIKNYIQENFAGLKIKTVNIMLGSLLIASFPIAATEVSAGTKVVQSYAQTADIYTVKWGDTLYKIANKYGITVSQLKSQNRLSSNMIYPGQKLEIPKHNIYVVKYGDTLYKIAAQYNIKTTQLMKHNRLTSDMIYPGQIIYIPEKELIDLINSLPYDSLSIGDRGEKVRIIQKAFNRLGYVLSEDGIFDVGTQAVVRDLQGRYADIANNGVYSPKVRAYLYDELLTDHIIVANPDSMLVLVNKNNALPKDYVPKDLVVPQVNFTFREYDPKKLMRKDAAAALEEMFREAKRENISLYAVSGYRSYNRQKDIFTSKVIQSGMVNAGRFSAKPGESEHQTGLAMDLSSPSVSYGLSQYFGETKEGQWVKKNAHKFGLIIRYEKGKETITGYQYEPWHIRYVGRAAAQKIVENSLTLEEYLGIR